LAFVTKHRRGAFTDERVTALQLVLADVCAALVAAPVKFNGEDDHVHLLVQHPPTVQLSKLVNSLEGVSSRRLRRYVEQRRRPG